jgi:hypothetical protein
MSAVAILDVSGAEGLWKQVSESLRLLPLATSLNYGEADLELITASTKDSQT